MQFSFCSLRLRVSLPPASPSPSSGHMNGLELSVQGPSPGHGRSFFRVCFGGGGGGSSQEHDVPWGLVEDPGQLWHWIKDENIAGSHIIELVMRNLLILPFPLNEQVPLQRTKHKFNYWLYQRRLDFFIHSLL